MRYSTINLDRERKLRFTINAMREVEHHYGGGMASVFDERQVGFEQLVVLLKVGLKHGADDKKWAAKLTNDLVGDLVQEHWFDNEKSMQELYEVLTDALQGAGFFKKADESLSEVEEEESPPA